MRTASPYGDVLAFYERTQDTGTDLYTLAPDQDRVPRELLVTPANEHSPMFSPDGRWLAYVSDETGQEEVYVRPYPGPGRTETVSTEGGRGATWSQDGRKLYYRSGNRMMSVSFRGDSTIEIGDPQVLFVASDVSEPGGGISYSTIGNNDSFLMIRENANVAANEIRVVFHWFDELERLVPTGR